MKLHKILLAFMMIVGIVFQGTVGSIGIGAFQHPEQNAEIDRDHSQGDPQNIAPEMTSKNTYIANNQGWQY